MSGVVAPARGRARVAVVDTGSGNLRSVEKALAAVGADVVITSDPSAVARADKVVVPGQGAFGGCMAGLTRDGGALREAVLGSVKAGKPYLGLCLGLQVLFESSEEDPSCAGLGLLPGTVKRFPVTEGLKIPHMGWNETAHGRARSSVLDRTPEGTSFYFVHSYYAAPARPEDVALSATHGLAFCAAVARDNVFACQFHPEKSQRAGLDLLASFVDA